MSRSLLINSSKYAISVTVLAGEGDGTLIYRTASGHIVHVGPDPDPAVLKEIGVAIKNIEAGVAQYQAAIGQVKAQ
jgi:hypothetical protein